MADNSIAKHTPGPWQFYADTPSTDPNWHIVTNASRMRVLANVHLAPDNETDLANASLIAAAPDLLAALQEARTSVQGNRDCLYEAHYQPHTGDVDAEGRIAVDAEDALLSRIDTAIAKAGVTA